jgi:hypothetical protein
MRSKVLKFIIVGLLLVTGIVFAVSGSSTGTGGNFHRTGQGISSR